MNINEKKTKEMIIAGSLRGHHPPLVISGQDVTQVSVFKLLGVTINNSLRRSDHIESITSKAKKRLWLPFLKQLKRAGVSQKDRVYYYMNEAVVIPVLEYAIKPSLAYKSHRLADQTKTRKLFKQIRNRTGHCLHHLLPAKRDETVTSRLRCSVKLPQLFARTNKFKNSFICFGLSNYQ